MRYNKFANTYKSDRILSLCIFKDRIVVEILAAMRMTDREKGLEARKGE